MPDSSVANDGNLQHWQQGDYALGVGGFIFADIAAGDELFDVEENVEDIVGLIVISQTCDIVRETGGRHYVAVCPLIKVDTEQIKETFKGRKPYLAAIENTQDDVFADLRRTFSVAKSLLATWNHCSGFSSEAGRVRFAAALERKFGQFAFPNEFDQATKKFRDRVWSRHDKTESEPGKVYRSIQQIRYRATPDWEASERNICILIVLNEEANREVELPVIKAELDRQFDKIEWPTGYKWDTPTYMMQTPDNLTASDILNSRRADFDFICF